MTFLTVGGLSAARAEAAPGEVGLSALVACPAIDFYLVWLLGEELRQRLPGLTAAPSPGSVINVSLVGPFQ